MSYTDGINNSLDSFKSTVTDAPQSLYSLEDHIQASALSRLERPNAGTTSSISDGHVYCSDPFGAVSDTLGGYKDIGKDIQAGKGKTITLELGVDSNDPKKYTVPLDDIGDKKGNVVTDGKHVKFKQTDGTLWDSEYNLGWEKDKKTGQVKFSWNK